jgi:hypothetical protein
MRDLNAATTENMSSYPDDISSPESVTDLGAEALSVALQAREDSCREVMLAYPERIHRLNPGYVCINNLRSDDDLLKQADGCDADLAAGRSRGWMHGFSHWRSGTRPRPWDSPPLLALGPVHTIFPRCVADQKGHAQGAKRSRGLPPDQALQRGAGPFWPQPEGKGVKSAPLVVARLGQTPVLAVAARLDWR